jgi:hypothetical protein
LCGPDVSALPAPVPAPAASSAADSTGVYTNKHPNPIARGTARLVRELRNMPCWKIETALVRTTHTCEAYDTVVVEYSGGGGGHTAYIKKRHKF